MTLGLLGQWKRSRLRTWITANVESRAVAPEFRTRLGRWEAGMLARMGLEAVAARAVPIESLYMQIRSEWPSQRPAGAPVRVVDGYLAALLRDYDRWGAALFEGDRYRDTDYYRVFQGINAVGFRYDWYDYPNVFRKRYSDAKVVAKMRALVALREAMRREGYRSGERAVSVLEEPFENTRFGARHPVPRAPEAYEVWSGHHRVAALASMGAREVEVVVLRDAKGGPRRW